MDERDLNIEFGGEFGQVKRPPAHVEVEAFMSDLGNPCDCEVCGFAKRLSVELYNSDGDVVVEKAPLSDKYMLGGFWAEQEVGATMFALYDGDNEYPSVRGDLHVIQMLVALATTRGRNEERVEKSMEVLGAFDKLLEAIGVDLNEIDGGEDAAKFN